MKILLILLAVVGLYYTGYVSGRAAGYSEAVQDSNIEVDSKRTPVYAGQLINAKTGEPTGIPYYTIER